MLIDGQPLAGRLLATGKDDLVDRVRLRGSLIGDRVEQPVLKRTKVGVARHSASAAMRWAGCGMQGSRTKGDACQFGSSVLWFLGLSDTNSFAFSASAWTSGNVGIFASHSRSVAAPPVRPIASRYSSQTGLTTRPSCVSMQCVPRSVCPAR